MWRTLTKGSKMNVIQAWQGLFFWVWFAKFEGTGSWTTQNLFLLVAVVKAMKSLNRLF
jgi:hypothetical protein